jgi:hypothetical protein
MNASTPLSHAPSGTYRIVPAAAEEFAKRDAWIVEMTLISKPYEESGEVCKRRLDRAGGAELLGVWSMNTQCLDLDLHRLDLRFAGARVAEPRAVERIARSIERGGQGSPLAT